MNQLRIAYYKGKRSENKSATLLDWLICFFTRSRFSHVEIVTDYNPHGLSRCVSSSPRDNGVRSAYIDLQSGHWEVYTIGEGFDYTAEDVNEYFSKHLGKKYDWFGALGVVVPFINGKKNRWFCSEIAADFFGLDEPSEKHPRDVFEYFARFNHRPVYL